MIQCGLIDNTQCELNVSTLVLMSVQQGATGLHAAADNTGTAGSDLLRECSARRGRLPGGGRFQRTVRKYVASQG